MENQTQSQTSGTQAEKTTGQLVELNFESIPMLVPCIDKAMYEDCRKLLLGPKRFRQVKFEEIDKQYQPQVMEVIDSLFTDEPRGLFLTGDVGTGKTSILRVIWRYLVSGLAIQRYRYLKENGLGYHRNTDRGLAGMIDYNYEFLTNWELVRDLRGEVSDSEIEYGHKTTPFLFLDDLGRGFDDKAGWNLALQDEFFDSRWQACLPTFITTNKTPKQLREWDNWSRIVDRLCDPSWMVMVNMGDGSRRKA